MNRTSHYHNPCLEAHKTLILFCAGRFPGIALLWGIWWMGPCALLERRMGRVREVRGSVLVKERKCRKRGKQWWGVFGVMKFWILWQFIGVSSFTCIAKSLLLWRITILQWLEKLVGNDIYLIAFKFLEGISNTKP